MAVALAFLTASPTMVLINGVKYACERCIRGHRVTTCTHTDQPLTMIKPKGRPASQCSHCREQRKNRNTHITCTCGKKGKLPGMHLALCLCHKNLHCTCATTQAKSKMAEKKKKLGKTASDVSLPLNPPSGTESAETSNTGYVIDDVAVPFESGHGLFDLFLPHLDNSLQVHLAGLNGHDKPTLISPPNSIHNFEDLDNNDEKRGLDADMMENMFPLFPLVGAQSFDDNRNLPLLLIPGSVGDSSDYLLFSNGGTTHSEPVVQKPVKNPVSLAGHYQPIRPKRPESVLSMASNSSTTSKLNYVDTSFTTNNGSGPTSVHLLGILSLGAFPPFDLSEESNDESNFQRVQNLFFDSRNAFSDTVDLRLNDYEDFIKNLAAPQERTGSIDFTHYGRPSTSSAPQLAAPSRQSSQLRRNTLRSRNFSHPEQFQPQQVQELDQEEPYDYGYPQPLRSKLLQRGIKLHHSQSNQSLNQGLHLAQNHSKSHGQIPQPSMGQLGYLALQGQNPSHQSLQSQELSQNPSNHSLHEAKDGMFFQEFLDPALTQLPPFSDDFLVPPMFSNVMSYDGK